jgi:tight adherence protein C
MDILLVACVSAAFMAVAGIAFAVGQLVTGRNRLQRRLPASARISGAATGAPNDGFGALVAERFTEDRFGIGGRFRQELRLKMVRAGYFSQNAVRFYVFARVCAIIAVPSIVLASCVLVLPNLSTLEFVLAAASSAGVGVLGPDAYLSHRQSQQIGEYRLNFPDLLDLLTVCVTAGLTVEASFERIRKRHPSSPCFGIRWNSAATSPRRCVNLAKICVRRECSWLKRRQMNCRSRWLSRSPWVFSQ